jgi:hypothetical protein
MTGPVHNVVEFDVAVRHAKLARADRQYARDLRRHQLNYNARMAEESARYHEHQVRAVAALAIVTGSAA